MKKFKEFKVNATSNKIVQNEVKCHLTKLGYESSGLKGGSGLIGGFYLMCESGATAWQSKRFFLASSRPELTLDDFFALTPEDVVVEPERFDFVFSRSDAGFTPCFARLTTDQFDRIKDIMTEGEL